MGQIADRLPAAARFRTRTLALAWALAVGICGVVIAAALCAAAEDRKALLLLPVASGTPGQGWSAQALGGILEDGFGSLRSVRLVTGAGREAALRELSASAAVTPESFREICRRAGADFAVLGGSTFAEGRLALEIRIFDVGSGLELLTFRGEEPAARAFALVEAAIRHVADKAGLEVNQPLFPRGTTASLQAYAAYRAALLEEAPAARIEKLREVLKLDPDYADPTRLLGVELFRQGLVDEALVVLERGVALGPKVAEARNNLGVALAAAGRPEQAQREFEEAVALAPDYAEARLNLARVLEERSLFKDAEKQYDAILETDAGNDKARAGLAGVYDRTGRAELAIKEFRLLSVRRPDLAEGGFILAGQEARKAREYARAEKFFRRAAEINPQFATAWAELGTNSYLAGDYLKGVEYFRKALTLDPGQAAYHYYLGLALDKGKQQEEALREFRRAVELGGPPEARLGLARAALDSGDPGLAVEELNRLLVASPENAEAKVLLAKATGEMEARRRLVESQSQFANQRLSRLEQIVADANRANRELEARLRVVTQEKRRLEEQAPTPVRDTKVEAELTRDKEKLRVELTEERAAHRAEVERLKADIAAAEAGRAEHAKTMLEVAELKGQLQAAQITLAKAEDALKAERERGERAVSAERDARRVETDQLKAELAAGPFNKAERDRFVKDLAEEKSRTAAAQARVLAEVAAREKAEQAFARERDKAEQRLAVEREQGAKALADERAGRRGEVEKLKAELAGAIARAQDRDRLAQETVTERARADSAQAAREKAERALSELRASDERAAAAEREEVRRQSAQAAARVEGLEAQVKAQAEKLRAGEADLAAARVRESAIAAQQVKVQSDLDLLAARYAALEARAAAEAKAHAEREGALEKARSEVRELALELGRIALRTQSWEKAREYLEQAAEVDPRSGEAWYGLGEAYFQLGQYEKSKQMYERAKQIY